MSNGAGKLYIVATPIGNLEDLSLRAARILSTVDLIAAEDTRHSRRLLQHYAINTQIQSYHDFNEEQAGEKLISILQSGKDIALISDAGTPLINDPGYRLVRLARGHNIEIIPVPGPSALIVALSVAGLPTDRFLFEGYAPAKAGARRRWFHSLVTEERTLVFYETPHRIRACLHDAVIAFGPQREAVLARELTKQFETIIRGTLQELNDRLVADDDQRKGEFVVVIHGADSRSDHQDGDIERLLAVLLEELPLKQAARLAARITGGKKNDLYSLALKLRKSEE